VALLGRDALLVGVDARLEVRHALAVLGLLGGLTQKKKCYTTEFYPGSPHHSGPRWDAEGAEGAEGGRGGGTRGRAPCRWDRACGGWPARRPARAPARRLRRPRPRGRPPGGRPRRRRRRPPRAPPRPTSRSPGPAPPARAPAPRPRTCRGRAGSRSGPSNLPWQAPQVRARVPAARTQTRGPASLRVTATPALRPRANRARVGLRYGLPYQNYQIPQHCARTPAARGLASGPASLNCYHETPQCSAHVPAARTGLRSGLSWPRREQRGTAGRQSLASASIAGNHNTRDHNLPRPSHGPVCSAATPARRAGQAGTTWRGAGAPPGAPHGRRAAERAHLRLLRRALHRSLAELQLVAAGRRLGVRRQQRVGVLGGRRARGRRAARLQRGHLAHAALRRAPAHVADMLGLERSPSPSVQCAVTAAAADPGLHALSTRAASVRLLAPDVFWAAAEGTRIPRHSRTALW